MNQRLTSIAETANSATITAVKILAKPTASVCCETLAAYFTVKDQIIIDTFQIITQRGDRGGGGGGGGGPYHTGIYYTAITASD